MSETHSPMTPNPGTQEAIAVSEMVERVARAIWAARRKRGLVLGGPDIGDWEDENETLHENVRREAVAAIKAMEEPTEEMKYVGGTLCEDMMFGGEPPYTGIIFEDMGSVFKAMISTAIQEKEV